MSQGNSNYFSNWQTILKHDFPASIVVFLVALPLCMGIAIASGVPPVAGLITGIVGGLVVGWIAGCPLQVSGPAAGLAVVVYNLVSDYQNDYRALNEGATDEAALRYAMSMLGVVVLLAGVIQFVAGIARLGQWFRAVSPAVIQGMLAGIAHGRVGTEVSKTPIPGMITTSCSRTQRSVRHGSSNRPTTLSSGDGTSRNRSSLASNHWRCTPGTPYRAASPSGPITIEPRCASGNRSRSSDTTTSSEPSLPQLPEPRIPNSPTRRPAPRSPP